MISRENLYNPISEIWLALSFSHSLSMKYFLLIFIKIPIAFYILLCLGLYIFQSRLLFFPSSPYLPHYEKISKNPNLKNIQIQTEDGNTLDGWMQVRAIQPYTVLYF